MFSDILMVFLQYHFTNFELSVRKQKEHTYLIEVIMLDDGLGFEEKYKGDLEVMTVTDYRKLAGRIHTKYRKLLEGLDEKI